jgi:hypothetical protein
MTLKHKGSVHSVKFWAALIAGLNVLHLWLFLHLPNAGAVQFWMTITIHLIACIAPFWMLAHWFVKRGKKLEWQRWKWLFFVPWGFLWYIFEKSPRPAVERTGNQRRL